MKLGDPIRPNDQKIDAGTLARLFKAANSDPSPISKFGSSPLTGKMFTRARGMASIGIEGGYGISTSNAETGFGVKGKMLRKHIRIDKCPWPDGQQAIRMKATLSYSHGIGATSTVGTTTANFIWNRNTTFNYSMDAFAPNSPIFEEFGFSGGSGGCDFVLTCHGVGPGRPLVQNDGNPVTNTYVQLDTSNPRWAFPPTWAIAGFGDSTTMTTSSILPCPQWANQQIFFPGGPYFYEAASYIHGPIGIVMAMDWTLDVVGTPGFNPFAGPPDPASWIDGTDDDGLDSTGNII